MESNNVRKVVLMGLDNSGKTSIVLCLKGVKNLLSFYSLNPTKGFNVENFNTLGTDFSIWDFGGQEAYRSDHLTNFRTNIKSTNKIIYVIDIQDSERYDSSLDFMKEILKLTIEENLEIKFSIFLHKYDPDIKISEAKVEGLIKKIRILIPTNFNIEIYKTSIFTVFQKTEVL
jgi:GTPase SAR1 family protein